MEVEKKTERPVPRTRMTCLIWAALLLSILLSIRICSSVVGYIIDGR